MKRFTTKERSEPTLAKVADAPPKFPIMAKHFRQKKRLSKHISTLSSPLINDALADLAQRVEKLKILYKKKPEEYKKAYDAANQLLYNLNQNIESYNKKEIDIIAFTGLSHMHIQQALPILSYKKYGAWTRFLGHFRQLLNRFFSNNFGVAKTFENELVDFKQKADKLSLILQEKNKKLPEELIRLYPNNKVVIAKCYAIFPLLIKSASPAIIKKLIKNTIAPVDAVKAFPDDKEIVIASFKIDQNSIRFASATLILEMIHQIPPAIIKELLNNKIISPDEAVKAFPDDQEILKVAIANIKEFSIGSVDEVIRLMGDHLLAPHVIARKYPRNLTIIEAAFNFDHSSIIYADIDAINKLAEKNVINIEDVLRIFAREMPTSQELATIEAEFTGAVTSKNWAVVANICNKFWFEKPKEANKENIIQILRQSSRWEDLYKFGQFINFDDHQLTYGPLPKSPETYELEELTRKMMETGDFSIENINGDDYFKFTDGTQYNWTKIRVNADLQHIDLVESDFTSFRKFMNSPAASYFNSSDLSEWKYYIYLKQLYQGQKIPESPINFAEMMAINAYTGGSCSYMNGLMRDDKIGFNYRTAKKDEIRQALVLAVICASGLRKIPTSEIKISYRGDSFRNEDHTERIEALLKKGVIELSGFVSSSIEASRAMPSQPVRYTFHNLRGVRIDAISKFRSEKEYLIPPTQIQILNYKVENGNYKFEASIVSDLRADNTEQFEPMVIKDLEFLSKINPETIISLIDNGSLQPQIALETFPNRQKVALACFKKDQATTLLLASPIIIKELINNEHISFDSSALSAVLLRSPNKIIELINNKIISLENIVTKFPDNKEIILAAYAIDPTIIRFAAEATIKELMNIISFKDAIIAFPGSSEFISQASVNIVLELVKESKVLPEVAIRYFPFNNSIVCAAYLIDPASIRYASVNVVTDLMYEGTILPEHAVKAFPNNEDIINRFRYTAISQNRNSLFANSRKDGIEPDPEQGEKKQEKPE